MAIIRPGHVVGAVSGNLGAVNFVYGKSGVYVRTKANRTNQQTQRQLTYRQRFKVIRKYWLELTEDQRTAWNAQSTGVKLLNRLGVPRKMTGFELYLRTNLPYITDYLPTFYEPTGVSPFTPPYNVTFSVTLPDDYVVTWECDWPVGDYFTQFYTARPVIGHRSFPAKRWRQTRYVSLPVETFNLKNDFIAQWGVPAVGEWVVVRMYAWGGPYLRSIPVDADCIVT